MRICDLCDQKAPDARSLDAAILVILKDTYLTSAAISEILDALKIKNSITSQQKSYGDICGACVTKLTKDVNKIVKDGFSSIAKGITELIQPNIAKINPNQENIDFFNRMTSDFPVMRK